MNNFPIKKLEEIKAEAICDSELSEQIRHRISELEQAIKDAIQASVPFIKERFGFEDYCYTNFDGKTATQIIVFHILASLKDSGYKFVFSQNEYAINVKIFVNTTTNVEKKIDAFFRTHNSM